MSTPEKIMQTRTFIGSSSEGLFIANAIRANLLDTTDCQIWTEGVFLPGRTFIETLESMLDRVDYAILVASPDDTFTNRVQGLVVTLQSESIRSLIDRTEFERVRTDCAERLSTLIAEYEEDAKKLGVQDQAAQLTGVVLEAVQQIPFPEEASVTQDDVVGGLLSHLTGARSARDQVRDRFQKLTMRYEDWWKRHGPRVSGALTEFQGALISAM